MKTRTVTLAVYAPAYLPTVLSSIALRSAAFSVKNERSTSHRWLITLQDSDAALAALLDALPNHMVCVESVED